MTLKLQCPSHIKIEVDIKHARGVYVNPSARLFVRYRLRLDGSPRITTLQMDTRDSTTSGSGCMARWDDKATLECQGSGDLILPFLLQGHCGVTFELHRRRRPRTFPWKLGKSSQLLGKGQVTWSEVLGSPGLAMEKWIPVGGAEVSCSEDGKPPALLVGIRIVVDDVSGAHLKQALGMAKSKVEVLRETCCCDQCKWVAGEEDMFSAALATAIVVDDF